MLMWRNAFSVGPIFFSSAQIEWKEKRNERDVGMILI